MEPWVPLTAALGGALVALIASWTAGDMLTAQTRLRRRLDKELAILDRMPEGYAKERLQRIVQRDALDLIYRAERHDPHQIRWVILLSLAILTVFLTLLAFVLLRFSPQVTGDPVEDYVLPIAGPFIGAGMVYASRKGLNERKEIREKFVSEKLSEKSAEKADADDLDQPDPSTR